MALVVLQLSILVYEIWIKMSTESHVVRTTAFTGSLLASAIGISTSLLLIFSVSANANQELSKYNIHAILFGLLLLAILVFRCVSYARKLKLSKSDAQ